MPPEKSPISEQQIKPPEKKVTNVISHERFESARLQREKDKRIEFLKNSLPEIEAKCDEFDNYLSKLCEKYGNSYGDLGNYIEDEIVEREVDLDHLEEKLHTRAQVDKIKQEIEEMERDKEKWETVYYEWQKLEQQIHNERIELCKLIGKDAFRDYYLSAFGIESEEADELAESISKSAIEREEYEEKEKKWREMEIADAKAERQYREDEEAML
ncbi:MAG: hypothetical protein NTW66_00420 [Candidatus Magasanikbacteria bacterium]|nr:hypothetical protein [Candidatus Magasanikbacteria bacterium]